MTHNAHACTFRRPEVLKSVRSALTLWYTRYPPAPPGSWLSGRKLAPLDLKLLSRISWLARAIKAFDLRRLGFEGITEGREGAHNTRRTAHNALWASSSMPPGIGAGHAELGEEGHVRVLTISELREATADITAANSWDGWVAAVQHRLGMLRSHTMAVVSWGADTHTLSEKTMTADALCAALANGMQLLCAEGDRRWLKDNDGTNAAAGAAGQSLTRVMALIDASLAAFRRVFQSCQSREQLASSKLDHAGMHCLGSTMDLQRIAGVISVDSNPHMCLLI
jgi:hypothetical protein